MKKAVILSLAVLLNFSCDAQEKEKIKENSENSKELVEENKKPKGTWKVDKEFDENGNMIRFDSIYSWSSENFDDLTAHNPDSLLRSFQSRFYQNFSGTNRSGFEDMFSSDSLFSRRFFNNDFFSSEFGEDFMDIDRMQHRMENLQREFLEKYQTEYERLENNEVEKNE